MFVTFNGSMNTNLTPIIVLYRIFESVYYRSSFCKPILNTPAVTSGS